MSAQKENGLDTSVSKPATGLNDFINQFTSEVLEPVPTKEELRKAELLQRVNKLSVNPNEVVVPRTYALQINDDVRQEVLPLCPLGDISLISGQQKSKKTFLTTAICAAFISNETILEAFSTSIDEEYKNVLFYDTEQNLGDVITLTNRIKRLSKLDDETFAQRFESVTLREEINPKEVEELIEVHLEDRFKHKKYGLVILDGIADLMTSTNDEDRSFEIVRKLMRWSTIYNCHIISVIHKNRTNGQSRGYLGLTMERKGTALFDLEVNATNPDISTVKFGEVRGVAIPKVQISFSINKDGLPYRVDSEDVPIVSTGSKSKKSLKDINPLYIKNFVECFYKPEDWPNGIKKSVLRDKLKNQLEIKGYNKEYKTAVGEVDLLITFLTEEYNVFYKKGTANQNTTYFLNTDYQNIDF